MKIGPKVGLLVAGLVAAQVVTVAGSGYLLVSEGQKFGALVQAQSEELNTVGNLTLERGEQNRAFAELALYGSPQPGETPERSTERYHRFLDQFEGRAEQLALRTGDAEKLTDPVLIDAVRRYQVVQDQVTKLQTSRLQSIRTGTYDPQQDIETLRLNDEGQVIMNEGIMYAHQKAAEGAAAQEARSKRIIGIAGLISLALILGSIAFAAVIAGTILRPLRRLTRAAQHVADTELPETVAKIRRTHGDVQPPTLAKLSSGTTGDELETLSVALNDLQDSAVTLAVETRKQELAAAETLVNLGQRNQSLLNRTLSYVGELERNERDPKVLANLFRLDHLTTRIRRNAESMLVLAGAEQARTTTKPVSMANVARASLSEIEDYNRVQVGELGEVAVHGPHAADLSHLLAELLENATRFSPSSSHVFLEGAPTATGYRFIVRDQGLGMKEDELATANRTITTAEHFQVSTKVLGLHVVGRLAARRGIDVELRNGDIRGCVAVIDLPAAILLTASAETTGEVAQPVVTDTASTEAPVSHTEVSHTEVEEVEAPVAEATEVVEAEVARTESGREQVEAPAGTVEPAPAAAQAVEQEQAVQQEQAPVRPPLVPGQRQEATPVVTATATPAPAAERPAPITQAPIAQATSEAGPRRRVRGAQMPDLGDSQTPEIGSRDAAAVGRQLSGLQSSVARARRESSEND